MSGCTKGKDIVKRLSLTKYNACDTWHIPLFPYLIFIYRCSFFTYHYDDFFARGFFLPKRKRSARWSLILLQFSAILKLLIFHYYEDSEKYICTNHSFRVGLASHSAYWKMSNNAIKLLGRWNTNVFNLTSERLICVLRPNHII